jgi:hypothetical protein
LGSTVSVGASSRGTFRGAVYMGWFHHLTVRLSKLSKVWSKRMIAEGNIWVQIEEGRSLSRSARATSKWHQELLTLNQHSRLSTHIFICHLQIFCILLFISSLVHQLIEDLMSILSWEWLLCTQTNLYFFVQSLILFIISDIFIRVFIKILISWKLKSSLLRTSLFWRIFCIFKSFISYNPQKK